MSQVQAPKKQMRKKTNRKLNPIVKLACIGMVCFSGFLLFRVGKEIYTTYTLNTQLNQAKVKYEQVQTENGYLTSEKDKLEDPNYVQSYARDNYMLSKDGEQIFYLPEKDN